ncbi:hypothetical protein BKA70DRAFT_1215047 [Coprinopsis sp. MPI-PUGE-AT-0042]|nr:hypothetical protein BKA70DRAFT_1215047 [Coprinopsis sp. MPI-PUGE-AT-0042]
MNRNICKTKRDIWGWAAAALLLCFTGATLSSSTTASSLFLGDTTIAPGRSAGVSIEPTTKDPRSVWRSAIRVGNIKRPRFLEVLCEQRRESQTHYFTDECVRGRRLGKVEIQKEPHGSIFEVLSDPVSHKY